MFKRSASTQPTKVVAYNTPIFALYCFLEMDTQHGEYLLELLSQFDVDNNQTVLVNEFALRYAGKQHHAFVALFLLFKQNFEDFQKEKTLEIDYHHRIIMQTLSHVTEPCFTPFFEFLCFLFHFITVEDTDYLEYIYWSLTKGDRTLDRGEVATLLQVMLMENKDTFVTKYKLTIERLLVDEGSEVIVLNRFQIINASLGSVFTRCITDIQLALQSNLHFGSYWHILTKKLHFALYVNSDVAYGNLKHWRNLAVNNDILLERKHSRKLIRNYLRLVKSYRTLRDNTTLMFKNNGFNMSKMMVKLAQKLVETIQRHDENEPQMEAKLDSSTGEVKMVVKAGIDNEQSKSTFAEMMMKKLLPTWMQAPPQEIIFQVKEEEVDPFAFEKRLVYTLTTPVDELLETAKVTRENASDILDETELMMAELNAMDTSLANMSQKIMQSFKGMTSEKRREEEELMMSSAIGRSRKSGKSGKSNKSHQSHFDDQSSQGSHERGNRRRISRASASRRSRLLSRSASKSHDSLDNDNQSNSGKSRLAQRRKSLQQIKEESFKRMSSGILSAASHSDSDSHVSSPSSRGSRSSSSRSLKSSLSRGKSIKRQASSKTEGPIAEGDEEDEEEGDEYDEENGDEVSEYNERDEVDED